MSLRHLPDTNILSAYLKRERAVVHRFREIDYYLSSIVLGELYTWAFMSARKAERLSDVRIIAQTAQIVGVDEITSEFYGRLVMELEQSGSGVSKNDLWIAAQALQHNLTIVTRDSDFDRVPSVNVERW